MDTAAHLGTALAGGVPAHAAALLHLLLPALLTVLGLLAAAAAGPVRRARRRRTRTGPAPGAPVLELDLVVAAAEDELDADPWPLYCPPPARPRHRPA
ncbi:hypothetical protein MRU69_02440 [Kocuria flava]|uniref:hypothetical protein n=1 Tax=Kocuria flava TaxID=446860 RepID=UPI001FF59C01|nr:hypothetical protein [Kocuria flava]MCJ8503723.1 hypothetical protein [Kocuria flava]